MEKEEIQVTQLREIFTKENLDKLIEADPKKATELILEGIGCSDELVQKTNNRYKTLNNEVSQNLKKIKNGLKIVSIVLAIMVISWPIGIFMLHEKGYLNEKELVKQLELAITNNADFETLKSIYIGKVNEKHSKFHQVVDRNIVEIDKYFTFEKALIQVKANKYLDDKLKEDTLFMNKINSLIYEAKYVEPFEYLSTNQKYYFTALRDKMEDDYSKISPEMDKIAFILRDQNNVVKSYLKNANNAYRNSSFALLVSLISLFLVLLINYKNLLESVGNIAGKNSKA